MSSFFRNNLPYAFRIWAFTSIAFFVEIYFAFWCFRLPYPELHVVIALSIWTGVECAITMTVIHYHLQEILAINEAIKKLRGVDS